jgi:cytoskeletal protein RodZ
MNDINYTPIDVDYSEETTKTKLLEYIKENKALVFTIGSFTVLTVLVSGILLLNKIKEDKAIAQKTAVETQTKQTVNAPDVKSATDSKLSSTPTPIPKTPTRPPSRTPTKTPTKSPTPTHSSATSTPTKTLTPIPTSTTAPTSTPVHTSTPVPTSTQTPTLSPTTTDTPVPIPS